MYVIRGRLLQEHQEDVLQGYFPGDESRVFDGDDLEPGLPRYKECSILEGTITVTT